MEEEKKLAASKLFQVVNDKKYLDGEVKYDMSLYTTIDIGNVDYIIVSKIDNIYALPFLTEGFRFKGEIIMTQPALQVASEILKEFVVINEQRREKGKSVIGGNDGVLGMPFSRNIWDDVEELDLLEKDGLYITEWLSCYKEDELEACLSKVRAVNYGETLELKGGLTMTARSSGYHLGSAAFSFKYGIEDLLILDSYSTHNYRHSLPLSPLTLKGHSRILITDTMNEMEGFEPNSKNESLLTKSEITINRFVSNLKKILKDHMAENILIPVRSPLFLLDLLDILQLKVSSFKKIHIISKVFTTVVSYANANVEYLNEKLQRKIYGKTPDLPISIKDLMENRRLEVYEDMFQFVNVIKVKKNYIMDKTPSLYIVVDNSLRLGYSAKIQEILNNELQAGTILFSDPYLKTTDIFHPLYNANRLRISTMPFNMNDDCAGLVRMLKSKLKGAELILPKRYKEKLTPLLSGFKCTFLEDNSAIQLPLASKEGLFIKPQTYNALKVTSLETLVGRQLIGADLHIGVLSGGVTMDKGKNKLEVEKGDSNEAPAILAIPQGDNFGEQSMLLKMHLLAQNLALTGFDVLNVEKRMDEESVYVVKLTGKRNSGTSIIKHSPTQTEVFCDDDTEYVMILKCLSQVLGVFCI